MILITLGTQKQKFYRLLDAVEKLNLKDEIIVQAGGSSDYKSKNMKIFDLISYDELDKLLDKADLVITHGGTGSIVSALKKGKKVIACPRLSKYNEHVDDHQLELIENFAASNYLLKYDDGDNLNEIIKNIDKLKPQKFISNRNNFIKKLLKKID